MQTYTPAMQQYIDIKKQNQDCILFFRIWDFYEVFFEDALTTSKALDLILTSKNKNSDNPIPMAGIPHHSVEKYIKRMIEQWFKVAIAEQTTAPQLWKIVEREVVSIITPWTYIQETSNKFNYMLSITNKLYKDNTNYHIARWDFAIWEYQTKSFSEISELISFIINITPTEIIFDINFTERKHITTSINKHNKYILSIYDIPHNPEIYISEICKIQSTSSFGKALEKWRLHAFALLTNYLKNTQKNNLTNINKISLHSQNDKILLDNITIKNLEIFTSSYESNEKYSLFGILNNTKTSGWSRLLYYILANPINNIKEIHKRSDNIQYYQENSNTTTHIHKILNHILDIPKIISTILYKKTLPSNFSRLRTTLQYFFHKTEEQNILIQELIRLWLSQKTSDKIKTFTQYLEKLLKQNDEINNINNEINFIQDNYNTEIDKLRKIAFNSDKLLLDYQQELINITKVQNIKIKYIKNQWYFIELTNKDIKQFEDNLTNTIETQNEKFQINRRSTLKWAQRYNSPYLNTIEQKIFSAKEELIQKEFELLEETKQYISDISKELNDFAKKIARLDLFTSQAILAQEKKYCKPTFHTKNKIEITQWRHPVIEEHLPIEESFIPNNLNLSEESFLHIITGPNMWWKSTFLRQNAIIILMAHCWLFVPAQKANLKIVDGIFARVWSWDVIAKNQSTFMTEMIEVANILNNATSKSFIIFDELGRWTSTYDGLALTKAILENIAQITKTKTIIATHYHELIQLENQIPGIKNFSVSVYETETDVIFMKKITTGWANKSYGLDVAKLAGISPQIIQQAKNNLNKLEINPKTQNTTSTLFQPQNIIQQKDPQLEKIKTLLNSFNINNITPIQAIQLLEKIKEEL